MDTNKKDTFNEIKAALSLGLNGPDQTRFLHQQFTQAKQKPGESVSDFAFGLYQLAQESFSTMDAKQRDNLLRERFVAGLNHQISGLVTYSNPEDFEEAFTLAERLEGLSVTSQYKWTNWHLRNWPTSFQNRSNWWPDDD